MTLSLAKIYTHIIFSTKKRQPFFIEKTLQKKVHNYIAGVCFKLGCSDITIGGVDNHIHILLVLPKTIPFPTLIQKIKSASSKWIKSLYGYKSDLLAFQWQKGYGAFSVSQSNLSSVKNYIHNQESHHKKISYEEELVLFLAKHNIIYDKLYLFDD